jgi:hypothetical protein
VSKLISKAWEVLFLLLIGIAVISFILSLLRPYFYLIGLAILLMVITALGFGLFKLLTNRRRFF